MIISASRRTDIPAFILTDIFLRLIKMIIAPLVFTTLTVGIAKMGDSKTLTSSPTFALRVSGGGFPLLGDSCSRSTWFLLHRAA